MTMIDTTDIEILRHAVGVNERAKRTGWGMRNRYVCDPLDPKMKRLVDAGLAEPRGKPSELTGGDQCFVVTPEGCDFIGLTPAQKKRALE